jgi:hypothetical protein
MLVSLTRRPKPSHGLRGNDYESIMNPRILALGGGGVAAVRGRGLVADQVNV